MITSLTATPNIPIRQGEVIRIKDREGRPWRTYTVLSGGKYSKPRFSQLYDAEVNLNPGYGIKASRKKQW